MADCSHLMNVPNRANRKSVSKDGKTFWNNVGLTVWITEYNGKINVSVTDERTGERFPCFPPRQQQRSSQPQGGGGSGYRPPSGSYASDNTGSNDGPPWADDAPPFEDGGGW